MIPTSVTGSSPPTATLGSNMGGMQINNASNGSGGSINNSVLLGIASLILEGRTMSEDEYAFQTSRGGICSCSLSAKSGECGRQSPKPSTSRAALGDNYGSSGSTSALSIDLVNYQARKSSNSPDLSSSLVRDYYSSSSESASSSVESNHSRLSQKLSQLRQESPNAQHQGLATRHRIAVECPRGTDAEFVALAINTDHHSGNEERKSGGDFEIIRRMSINFYNSPNSMSGGGSNTSSGSMSGGSGSSENFMCSLQSLASNSCFRAGGSPLLASIISSPSYSNSRQMSNSSRVSTLNQNTQSAAHFDSGVQSSFTANAWYPSSSQTPHVSVDSCNNKEYLWRKTNLTPRMTIPSNNKTSAKSSATLTTPLNQNINSNIFNKRESLQNSLNSSTTTNSSNTTATATTTNTCRNQIYPQQGPHCDQFLRKMGLAKGETLETEEHHCDMSYVNITCTRWRAYCIKMENILARGEPICIEVYLGPVGHKILLEQWIITQKEKQPPPTMTLPSLCSAIRSQLYFSQISAWCDLIKKSDKTIYETGRIIFTTPPTTSAAGDLATTTATSNIPTSTITTATSTTSTHNPAVNVSNMCLPGNSGGSVSANVSGNTLIGSSGGIVVVGCGKRRPSSPRLNIFYRIKQYDSTACFNSKPNVHNFPNVNITENCCISVCLKSLPRITGGIPKVGLLTTQQQQQQHQQQQQQRQNSAPQVSVSTATTTATSAGKITKALTTTTTSANVSATTTTATTTETTNINKPTISIMNCDNNDNLKEQQLQQQQQQQQQQHNKTLTANSSCSSSYSYLINGNKTNQSLSFLKDAKRKDDKIDLNYGQSFDMSAGGDGCTLADSVGDCDSSNSSLSTNNCGNLSHREKQLLKYRKRMMKRDKKQQQLKNNEMLLVQTKAETDISNQQNKMEQGEDDDEDDQYQQHIKPNLANDQRQELPNNHEIINSIPSTNHHQLQLQMEHQQQQQEHHVKMISTGTQTVSNTCSSCGFEKSMVCLNCNPLKSSTTTSYDANVMITNTISSYAYEEMDAESSSSSSAASSLSSSDIIHTPRNKAELLLQAIQRTPKTNKKHKHKTKDTKQIAAIKQKQQQQQQQQQEKKGSSPSNSNQISNSSNGSNNISPFNGIGHMVNKDSPTSNSSSVTMVGCQVCKRQKTQHHYNSSSLKEDSYSDDNNSSSNAKTHLTSSTNPHEMLDISNSSNASKASTNCNDDDEATGNGEEDNESDGGKMLSSDYVDDVSHETKSIVENDIAKSLSARSSNAVQRNQETMEEEYFETSTKLTPHRDRCSLDMQLNQRLICNKMEDRGQQQRSCSTPPHEQEKIEISSPHEGAILLPQFKTPTPSEQKQNMGHQKKIQQPQQPHKLTPKPNLLHIACNFNKNDNEQQILSKSTNHTAINTNTTPTSSCNPLLLRRSLPKVNLTPIFCNPSSVMAATNTSTLIPIENGVCNDTASSATTKSADINITEASPTFSFESPSSPSPSLTVQKSNSAPTLPNTNSSSLSPRFVKASAIYKRRSRHLSDRSDRSSLGSDEQFSDEDVDSGMYSPFATSPVKLRARIAAVFGRKPLLGNLEECLLQRRLVPKIEVMGFKLLLGASGGFCPTQLTIPAAAYFYELKGETLSTPYLCEIRLPRKGYTVPRCGTVQATLLNPMGMVVRMFVIPYDMRDMPSLHQTFIRQRILADTGIECIELSDIHRQNGNCRSDDNVLSNETINAKQLCKQEQQASQSQQRSPQCDIENHQLGHFISAENMKSLRYSIHLRFQTSRSGRLMLHTDIRLLISRRTDCDTAAAHAKGVLEAPNELITNTVMPTNPKYSARQDQTSSKI